VINVENYGILIIGILGAILSPLGTILGLYLQHAREKKKLASEIAIQDAEAAKMEAEAKVLEIKSNIETVNYYIGMVTALRAEVNALTELSRRNGGEIAVLTARLKTSDEEKAQLAKENETLVKKVQDLEREVALLKAGKGT
jgi:cell division protein FtsB